MKITIICEGYNKSRYNPLHELVKRGNAKSVDYINLTYLKYKPYKIPLLFFQLVKNLFNKNVCFISSAPLSPMVIYYLFLKYIKKEKIVYDTSFPWWKERRYFIKMSFLKPIFEYLWLKFIKDLKIRTINNPSYSFLKKHSSKVFLIPHSVDTNIFYKDRKIKKNKKFTVLFAGKIEYKKGIDLILASAKKLTKIDFWLVGTGNYLKTVRKENLLNIKTFEWVEDAKKLNIIYNKCHCLILPSRKFKNWEELFGIVIIEAMATGIPVIASNCIGPKEIIENGKDGILFKKEDFNGLINSIMLLKNNEKLRKKLVKNANKKIVGKYIIEIVSKKLLSLIRTK
jgi:glycosyltransferase involved in cell wall biosynthesis